MLPFIKMTMKRIFLGFILFLGLLIPPYPVIYASIPHISLNQVRLYVDTPIVSDNGIIFVAIRDILPSLKGSITYRSFDDAYEIKFQHDRQTCLIVPNSKEYWINNTQHFFSAPTFYKDGTLYCPVVDFFKYLGGSVETTSSNIDIHYLPELMISTFNANSLKNSYLRKLDQLHIPEFEEGKKITVVLGESQINIVKDFYFNKDILMMDLTPLLMKENFNIQVTGNRWTIEKLGKKITFFSDSKDVFIEEDGVVTTRHLIHPAVIQKDKTFIPIQSFLSACDYLPYWNSETRTLYLLSKIREVRVSEIDENLGIKILSSYPVNISEPEINKKYNSYSVILKNTNLEIQSTPPFPSESPISSVIAEKISETVSKLTIYLKEGFAKPYFQKTSFGNTVGIAQSITGIKETYEKDSIEVTITGESALNAKIQEFVSPNRLVIDIPNSISKLPQVIRSNTAAYSLIRTSLFTKEPPSTRVVIDLKEGISLKKQIQNGQKLTLSFPAPKETLSALPPPAPKPSKRIVSAVDNKIIVIDPGHGGNDPGAIAKDESQEKAYTLDISFRLKALLESKGAHVLMCREGDENPSLSDRTEFANQNKPDIFISVHINSFHKAHANGTETYYFKNEDKPLALCLQKSLMKELDRKDLGIKKARLYVLRNSDIPAALVEPLFMTNPEEFLLLSNGTYRQKIANAIYEGIVDYFKK